MRNTLEIKNINKTYKRNNTKALSDYTCTLDGGVYGILGPNGAGKSTLFKILVGAISKDSGSIFFNGKDIFENIEEYKDKIGYMPQQQEMYPDLTVRKFLRYIGVLKGVNKKDLDEIIDYSLEITDLTDLQRKKIGELSGGMKQRVLLSQAILNDPSLLILDEPTAGLDPKQRVLIRNFLSKTSKEKIVLISTHVVSDIEHISKEIIIMDKGKIIIKDTPQNILKEYENITLETYIDSEHIDEINSKYNVSQMQLRSDGKTYVKIYGDFNQIPEGFTSVSPNLEDVYLYLFGR